MSIGMQLQLFLRLAGSVCIRNGQPSNICLLTFERCFWECFRTGHTHSPFLPASGSSSPFSVDAIISSTSCLFYQQNILDWIIIYFEISSQSWHKRPCFLEGILSTILHYQIIPWSLVSPYLIKLPLIFTQRLILTNSFFKKFPGT